MKNIENGLLAKVQSEVPFIDTNCSFINIEQGFSNTSFQLKTPSDRYFIKFFDSDDFVTRNRQYLFDIQAQISQLGLAIRPIYIASDCTFQIDEWYQGDNLDQALLSPHKKLSLVAHLMASLHTLDIICKPLDLKQDWHRYLAHVGHEHSDDLQLKITQHLKTYQESNENIFCHNDMSFANVLDSAPVIACDWEYAALGNRFFDLSGCIINNHLTNEQSDYFLREYVNGWKSLRPDYHLSLADCTGIVKDIEPVTEFTYQLWFEAQRFHQQAAPTVA